MFAIILDKEFEIATCLNIHTSVTLDFDEFEDTEEFIQFIDNVTLVANDTSETVINIAAVMDTLIAFTKDANSILFMDKLVPKIAATFACSHRLMDTFICLFDDFVPFSISFHCPLACVWVHV